MTTEQTEMPLKGKGVERVKIDAIDRAYRTMKPLKAAFAESSQAYQPARKKLIEKIEENVNDLPQDEAGNPFYITADGMRLTLQKKDSLSIDKEESATSEE